MSHSLEGAYEKSRQGVQVLKLNKERALVRAIKEIARDEGIQGDFFSHDWIIRLKKGSQTRHIMGYDFDLNSAASQLIAKDKCGASELLAFNGVPSVEHKLFLSLDKSKYIGNKSSWEGMIKYAKHHDYNLICKSNTGTGGNAVFHIKSPHELEKVVNSLFEKGLSIALSPFYKIENEYRVVVLDGRAKLVYCKRKPSVVGDGKSSLLQLVAKDFQGLKGMADKLLRELADFDSIPEAGELVELGWKHNLAHGSVPVLVEEGELRDRLSCLAIKASQVLNIKFGSVDIIEVEKELKVLEVNSGVMLEAFAIHRGYETVREIYRKAVKLMFASTKANMFSQGTSGSSK